MLTEDDEYSSFLFSFPCADVSAATVKEHLTSLFSILGNPCFVHAGRGTAFISDEFKEFPHSRNIATSRQTAFNPQGNGQSERYNGIIWQNVSVALRSSNLSIVNWEAILDVALNVIRSLPSIFTNRTPHECISKYLFTYQHG